MDRSACLIFILNFFCVKAAVNITQLRGPNSVEYGSTEEVVLGCDFEATNETDLEIKWYYNGDREVIYQWVPDSNKTGSPMGLLKDHIDGSYTATNDSDTMSLRIFNVTTNLTGTYTCKVSGFYNEDSETKRLTVYIPSKSGLQATLMEDNQTVVCSVAGVFPKPKMNLYLVEGNKTDVSNMIGEPVEYQPDENGWYNITAIYLFPNLTDYKRNTKFLCELTIPGTDYLLSKSIIYQGVEVNEYDLDEEDYIWSLNNNTAEEYSNSTKSTNSTNNTNSMEDNSAAIYSPGVRLSTALALLLLILCK